MTNDLSPPWEELQNSLNQHGKDIFESIDKLFDWADQELGELQTLVRYPN